MRALRGLGLVLLVLGLAALVIDAAGTVGEGFRLRAIGEWWFMLDRNSLQLAQPAIERHVAVWLWDPVILTVLRAPAAVVLLALGALLLVLARRRVLRTRL